MGLADIDSFLLPAPHLGEEGVLEVAYLPQNSPTTAVLFHPNPMGGGAMTNKVVSTLYRYARDQGHDVIRYNSRGVGRSSGTITAGLAEFEDAVCVLKWAMAQGTRRFWLGGFSFGGYMACLSADWLIKQSAEQDTAVDALCLIAPSIVRHNVHKLVLPAHRFWCTATAMNWSALWRSPNLPKNAHCLIVCWQRGIFFMANWANLSRRWHSLMGSL